MKTSHDAALAHEANALLIAARDTLAQQIKRELSEALTPEVTPSWFALGCYAASRRGGQLSWPVVRKVLSDELAHRLRTAQVDTSDAFLAHLKERWPRLDTVTGFALAAVMGPNLRAMSAACWEGVEADAAPSWDSILEALSGGAAERDETGGQPESCCISQEAKGAAMLALLDARCRVVSEIGKEALRRLAIYSATGDAELATEGAPWAEKMAKEAFQGMDPEHPNMDAIKAHLAGEVARRLYGEALCIPEELHRHMVEQPGLPAWTERGLEGGMFYLAKAWGVAEVFGVDLGPFSAEVFKEGK